MISRLIGHLRGNVIAYVALFVALGGTSYAATSLPRNSVGTPQLRNGAVTSAKLSGGLGAQVWSVATINAEGGDGTSSPRGIRIKNWRVTSQGASGIVVYPHRFPKNCVPLATAQGPIALLNPEDTPSVSAASNGISEVELIADSNNGITLAIVCPRGS